VVQHRGNGKVAQHRHKALHGKGRGGQRRKAQRAGGKPYQPQYQHVARRVVGKEPPGVKVF